MSSMASATHLFALFSREHSSIHPEYSPGSGQCLAKLPRGGASAVCHGISRLHRLTVEMGLYRRLGTKRGARRTGRAYPPNLQGLPCRLEQPVYPGSAYRLQKGFTLLSDAVVGLF